MASPPARRKSSTPAVPSVDAALYGNIGRYAGSLVLTVFEQIGGTQRMAQWADENPGEFYTKLLPKIISAPKQVEVTGKLTIEDAVKALDMAEGKDYTVVGGQIADAVYEEDDTGVDEGED